MENLTGGTPPVRYLPCVVPCKLYFPERESTVLRLRYGIPDDRCRTLDEISAQLGVTRERIRQIQVRAERHLREMLKRRSSFTLFAA